MIDYIILVLVGLAVILSVIALFKKQSVTGADIEAMRHTNAEELRALRTEITGTLAQSMQATAQMQNETQKLISEQQGERIKQLQSSVSEHLIGVQTAMKNNAMENEQKLENIRKTMENNIATLRQENSKKLDEMRQTVDEKLQKTLDDKLKQSFSLVSERLEQVYKGLGEMQTLATGVGDLKKVLSNVKTRGILGEIQLGAILEQILSVEQYEENIATVKGSSERVEFAVKLPGDGETPVYLPIDAKFPMEDYTTLLDAYDAADATSVELAAKELEKKIKKFAKDIHDKYIHVPDTTDFGVMFLPVEGLYAEVVRRGMIEKLQADYKIIIAGPTTLAALLNSLQMGFKTLAIQQRSSEVWNILSEVKGEFATFAKALEVAKSRIKQADSELDKLITTRTNVMNRKLRDVTLLPQHETLNLEENLQNNDEF